MTSPARRTPCARRALLWLALLPQMLILALGQAVVVCVGAGGHLRVELPGAACCSESAPTSDTTCAGDEGCGACVDLALVADVRAGRSSGSEADLVCDRTWAAPVELPGHPYGAPPRTAPPPQAPPHEPAHLAAVRTVVRRC